MWGKNSSRVAGSCIGLIIPTRFRLAFCLRSRSFETFQWIGSAATPTRCPAKNSKASFLPRLTHGSIAVTRNVNGCKATLQNPDQVLRTGDCSAKVRRGTSGKNAKTLVVPGSEILRELANRVLCDREEEGRKKTRSIFLLKETPHSTTKVGKKLRSGWGEARRDSWSGNHRRLKTEELVAEPPGFFKLRMHAGW